MEGAERVQTRREDLSGHSTSLTRRGLRLLPRPQAAAGKEGCGDFWKNSCPPGPLRPSARGAVCSGTGSFAVSPSGGAAEADCCFPSAGARARSWTPA